VPDVGLRDLPTRTIRIYPRVSRHAVKTQEDR
jgi:hypothetical protein